jgi:hypothetical protein
LTFPDAGSVDIDINVDGHFQHDACNQHFQLLEVTTSTLINVSSMMLEMLTSIFNLALPHPPIHPLQTYLTYIHPFIDMTRGGGMLRMQFY